MKSAAPWLGLLAALAAPPVAHAQAEAKPNGAFLVAKPAMQDPNFSQTVVLVTQAEDASTVGVIVNRPTALQLPKLLPEVEAAGNYRGRIFYGGPVMRQAVVALLRAAAPPAAPAFHVLKDLYLTTHPDNIGALLADRGARYRLYVGFAGWAPRQLEGEFEREGWYVLPADAETALREDTDGLWQELLQRAEKRPVGGARQAPMKSPAAGGAGCPVPPGCAARAALSWHGWAPHLEPAVAPPPLLRRGFHGIRTVARNPALPRLGNPTAVANSGS